MANWSQDGTKFDATTVNSNNEYVNGDAIQSSALNKVVEGLTYNNKQDEKLDAKIDTTKTDLETELQEEISAIKEDIMDADPYIEKAVGQDLYLKDTAEGRTLEPTKILMETSQNGDPTPDNPIDVNPTDSVLNQVSSGKNEWHNTVIFPYTAQGITIDYDEVENVYTLNGTSTGGNIIIAENDLKKFDANNNYTLSVKLISGSVLNKPLYIRVDDGTGTTPLIATLAPGDIYKTDTQLYLTDYNTSRYLFNFGVGGVCDNVKLEIQLEQDSTATPYVPYHEPITTVINLQKQDGAPIKGNGFPDHRDEVYQDKVDGLFKIIKSTEIQEFTTDFINGFSYTDGRFLYYGLSTIVRDSMVIHCLCNKIKGVTWANLFSHKDDPVDPINGFIGIGRFESGIGIVNKKIEQTEISYRNWLISIMTDMYVVYSSLPQTPIILNQEEAKKINQIPLFYGGTHITTTNDPKPYWDLTDDFIQGKEFSKSVGKDKKNNPVALATISDMVFLKDATGKYKTLTQVLQENNITI